MLNVLPVVMLVAAAAVLIGVVIVAMGRGGELAFFQPDFAPLKLDEVTSTDVALFRPPMSAWGYSMNATDDALSRIAAAITERDIEIATLQQQVADLQASAARRRAYGPGERADSAGFQGERAAQPPARAAGPPARPAEPPARPAEPPARSIWEPARPARPDSAETLSTSGWAALPKRSKGSAATGDDEDDR